MLMLNAYLTYLSELFIFICHLCFFSCSFCRCMGTLSFLMRGSSPIIILHNSPKFMSIYAPILPTPPQHPPPPLPIKIQYLSFINLPSPQIYNGILSKLVFRHSYGERSTSIISETNL